MNAPTGTTPRPASGSFYCVLSQRGEHKDECVRWFGSLLRVNLYTDTLKISQGTHWYLVLEIGGNGPIIRIDDWGARK